MHDLVPHPCFAPVWHLHEPLTMRSLPKICAVLCRDLLHATARALSIAVFFACSQQVPVDQSGSVREGAQDGGLSPTDVVARFDSDSGVEDRLVDDSSQARDAAPLSADNPDSEVKDGSISQSTAPAALNGDTPVGYDLESPVCQAEEVMFSGGFGCIISESRHLHCWGGNSTFAAGVRGGQPCGSDPESVCIREPNLVPGIDSVAAVASAPGATCAVRDDGSVWCWGSNISGLLGRGIEEICDGPGAATRDGEPQPCTPDPVRIQGLEDATDIDSWGAMCVSTLSGSVYTFGWYGRTSPVPVTGVTNAVAVEDGCALLDDGGVVCWPPDTLASESIEWDGLATDFTLGYAMGCVINDDGNLFCWNLDRPDNYGDCLSGISCAYKARLFELDWPVVDVSGGYDVMWILTDDGQVRPIVLGELGDPVPLPAPAVQISAASGGACALLDDRAVYCWTAPGVTNDYLELSPEPTKIELCQGSTQ